VWVFSELVVCLDLWQSRNLKCPKLNCASLRKATPLRWQQIDMLS
jgi:hypothetical protein